MNINRRDAIQRLSILMGGMISAPAMAGLNGQKPHATFVQFSVAQESLVAEIADTIIPTTDTPGAKAAGVEKFILRVVQDCYPEASQKAFAEGLAKLDSDCQARFGKGFIEASSTQRKEALTTCMLESDANRKSKKGQPTFFFMIKELTTTGYFTSEIGATKALEYLPIPGKFDGCMPLSPSQKTWAL
jgi:Gluconate 2-dehydrogenase subunit 3